MKWTNAADEKPPFYKEVLVYLKSWDNCFVTTWVPADKRPETLKYFPEMAKDHWDSYDEQITHWSPIELPA